MKLRNEKSFTYTDESFHIEATGISSKDFFRIVNELKNNHVEDEENDN